MVRLPRRAQWRRHYLYRFVVTSAQITRPPMNMSCPFPTATTCASSRSRTEYALLFDRLPLPVTVSSPPPLASTPKHALSCCLSYVDAGMVGRGDERSQRIRSIQLRRTSAAGARHHLCAVDSHHSASSGRDEEGTGHERGHSDGGHNCDIMTSDRTKERRRKIRRRRLPSPRVHRVSPSLDRSL